MMLTKEGRGSGRGGYQQRDMGPPDTVLGEGDLKAMKLRLRKLLFRNGLVCSCGGRRNAMLLLST